VTTRTPTEVLLNARRAASHRKRSHVLATVQKMKTGDAPITFAAVARAAQVSTWLVYAPGIREHIDAARAHQAAVPARETAVGRRGSDASLRTDLELVRQDNRTLRAEIARLKHLIRQDLGRQLDGESHHQLRVRVDDLSNANQRLQADNRELTAERDQLRNDLRRTEDDLAAARTSIRRMIREHSGDLGRNIAPNMSSPAGRPET
jgi:Family of unknown function (DUF6262)